MDFLRTNINDIIAYAMIVINVILYFVSNRKVNLSGVSLSALVRQNTKEQTQKTQEIMNSFTENAFKTLANENNNLKQTIQTMQLQINKANEKTQIESFEIKQVINQLQSDLNRANEIISKLNKEIYTSKEHKNG